jgi:hypothetical protein
MARNQPGCSFIGHIRKNLIVLLLFVSTSGVKTASKDQMFLMFLRFVYRKQAFDAMGSDRSRALV